MRVNAAQLEDRSVDIEEAVISKRLPLVDRSEPVFIDRANSNKNISPTPISQNDEQGAHVAKAQCGDRQAFCTLVEPHLALIYRSARKITANHEDAEDACQESLIKAFAHIQSFKGNSKFSTWLTRIAINEALMIVRKGRAEARHRLSDGDLIEMPRLLRIPDQSSGSDPEAQCALTERHELLWEAINRLKEHSRDIVCALSIDETDARDVAQNSNLSSSGVRSRRQRALRDLRTILDKKLSRNAKSLRESA
jgi:RNA polymerase sigma-70 factor (ECF subfamily)